MDDFSLDILGMGVGMGVLGMDMGRIADLATPVAQAGAIHADGFTADDVFDYTVGVAILIYEQDHPR